VIEHGHCSVAFAEWDPFASFSELGKQIAAALPSTRAVIDGEICSLDVDGISEILRNETYIGQYICGARCTASNESDKLCDVPLT
jgi:hypothetical protein